MLDNEYQDATAVHALQHLTRPPVTNLEQLPADLRKATVLLEAPNAAAPGGVTKLVRAVRPDVVMVELCKERLALLVDPENPDRRAETWHCRQVSLEGVPEDPLWPGTAQLLQLLNSRIGAAVTTQEIEDDVSRLLATGLFGKARPAAASALKGEAPQFAAVKPEVEDEEDNNNSTSAAPAAAAGESEGAVYAGDVSLQMVPPLGGLKFVVEPRVLPLISSMETADGADKEEKDKDDKDSSPSSDSSLPIYLKARARLAALFPDPSQVVVTFTGVESGRVEVLVRASRAADPAFVSGLESSAPGGEGVNIESFRPQRSSIQLSPGMLLPAEAAERLAAVRAARQAARVLGPPPGWQQRNEFRFWQQDEVKAAADQPQLPSNPVTDTFASLMTGLYSKLQAGAGDQVGITPGAAWRAALEAACEVGSQQVLLGDRPTDVSQRRLASSITGASGGRLLAALGLMDNLDKPFYVWGEDALLRWPGAEQPLIQERDQFMGRALAAAATGRNPNVPLYVADQESGQLIWRYMVPQGSTSFSAPAGSGDGPVEPLAGPTAVVAVVGSAHVRGMAKEWQGSIAAAGQLDELLRVE
eukprot:gene12413-12548_t